MSDELSPRNRQSWTSTEAHIFAVFQVPKDDFKTARSIISYSYTVDGILHLGDFTDYTDPAALTIKRGDTVTILYNPADPTKSKLPRHSGFGWKQIAAIATGVVYVAIKYGLHFFYVIYHSLTSAH